MNNDYTITAFADHLANIGYHLVCEWSGEQLTALYRHESVPHLTVAVYSTGEYEAAGDKFAHVERWDSHQGICELSVLTSHLAAGNELQECR